MARTGSYSSNPNPPEPRKDGGPGLSPDQPLDDLAANLMTTIARRGRGFVLDTAAGAREHLEAARRTVEDLQQHLQRGEQVSLDAVEAALDATQEAMYATAIEVRESLPPVDEYERPVNWRNHHLHDTDSFIGYCKAYGDRAESLVFYNESRVELIINELVDRGEREIVRLDFQSSSDFDDWTTIIGSPVTHKHLLRHLQAHEHNLDEPTLLQAMRRLRINATVDTESDIQEDGNTVGMRVRTSGGEELAKFPKTINIRCPVLDQDIEGESQWAVAQLRLEIVMPTEPGEGAKFWLRCPEWALKRRERIAEEGRKIAAALEGWRVFHGMHRERTRVLGRDADR